MNKDAAGTLTATFEDGLKVSGTLLVGCDGSRSATREFLVGKEAAQPTLMDIAMFNFTCSFDAEIAKRLRGQGPIFFNSYHPKGRMLWVSIQDVPDPAKPEDWLFQILFSWPTPPCKEDFRDQAARTAFLKSMAEEYAEPWRTIIHSVPDDLHFGVDGVTVWSPTDWSASSLAGIVTLAGDGAHPMSPYRGQGLNNGLDDAANLTELLSSTDCTRWPEAVRQYEAEMRERALREIPISAASAKMVHDYEQLVRSVAAQYVPSTDKAQLQSPIAKLGIRRPKDEDVPQQVRVKA